MILMHIVREKNCFHWYHGGGLSPKLTATVTWTGTDASLGSDMTMIITTINGYNFRIILMGTIKRQGDLFTMEKN